MLAVILVSVAVALAVFVWYLTLWGAKDMLLSGGFKRPLTVFPSDFNLRYEKVRFETADGIALSGWFLPAKQPSDATIIMCHGWGTNKGEILPATRFLQERYNLMYFDFRFCGESGGDMSTIGYLESRDFDAALAFLKSAKPEQARRIGVYGLSMGAATAFMGAARHPEIRAAVIENAFPSFTEVCRDYAWHKFHVPYYPLVAMVMWHTNRILKADPEAWSPRQHAPLIEKPAVFLIHAERDPLAKPEQSRRLYELVRGPKQLWIVPEAGHEDIHEVAQDEYRERILAFYGKHL